MEQYRQTEEIKSAEMKAYYIPARAKEEIYHNTKIRVCAYCRVSTDSDAQLTSFALQKEHYQNLMNTHPNWILKHIYADEGISGTSLKKRDEFNKMIAACRAGEYDLIITKSVSRFARNLVDCVSLARELKNQNPCVGIYFETDGLNTLMEDSELRLSILASFAQEESVKKSESMVGPLTRQCIQQVHFSKAFIGIDGWQPEIGFTGRDMMRTDVVNAVLEKECEAIVLTDSSKFGAVHSYSIGPVERFNRVITDSKIRASDLMHLEHSKLTVHVVDI